jgi:hypothetical protein
MRLVERVGWYYVRMDPCVTTPEGISNLALSSQNSLEDTKRVIFGFDGTMPNAYSPPNACGE